MSRIPSFKSYVSPGDVEAAMSVIQRCMFWADGPEIEVFERSIALHTGVDNVLVFNSGTSALLSALMAIDVREREVICPSFTFIATTNAVELAGGTPVFADSEADSFGLDVADVAARITPRTKAVMTINYGGCVCRDILALRRLCDERGLLLIEDSAQSFGARLHGDHAGVHSDFAIFSFCQNKVLSALGEGGALVTRHRSIHEKAKYLRSHGRVDDPGKKHFESSEDSEYRFPGFNFRMPSTNAAFGNSQLNNLSRNLDLRQRAAGFYRERLVRFPMIRMPSPPPGHTHCYQMFTVTLPSLAARDGLKNHLLEADIMVRCYFEPLHRKPYFLSKGRQPVLPVAERLGETVLTLPMYPGLDEATVDEVCQQISTYVESHPEQLS